MPSDTGKFGEGGGVHTNGNTVRGMDTITNSVINGNSATRGGGGLRLAKGFTMSGTKVTNNTSGQSGGGLVFESLNTAATVTTSTFTGNSAAMDGAGICVEPGTSATDAFNMHYSRIHGNTGTPHNGLALGCQASSGAATINAADNWWGCNGPASGTGCDLYGVTNGTTSSTTPTLSPYTVLALSLNNTSFPAGNTITATGSLESDSNGAVYSAANDAVYPGLPATLTIVQGDSATNSGASTLSSAATISTSATATQSGTASVTVDGYTVSTSFTVPAPPAMGQTFGSSTSARANSSINGGTGSAASSTLAALTPPVTPNLQTDAGGVTGSIFLAAVEQFGTSPPTGQVDLFNVTLGSTSGAADTFTAASPATLTVTNSTNEGKPDVDNPLNALFDSSGDLLIGNGGTTTGSPQDNGSVACVPAGAILTGQNSASTVTPNVDDPVGLAYDKRDGSVGISNNPTSSPVQLAEYILNSGLKQAAAARNLTASGYGSFGLTNIPALTAGTYAIGLTDGLETDPAHNTGKSKITILSPTGAKTDITDTTTFSIDIPRQLAWDGTNNQLVIANNSAFHKLLSFYTVSPVALVKTINTGRRNDKVAVSPDGHVAVSGATSFGVPQVQVYDGTTARTPVGGPIPFNGTTTSCGSTYIYGSGGGAVNSLVWLSNTKLLIAVQVYSGSNSTAQNGLYIYDISATAVPPGYDDVTCSSFAAAPKQTGFVHLATKPFAAAFTPNGTFAEAAGGSNCGGNSPCYNSINTAIANTAAGGVVNVYGGTFNESVNLTNNVILNLDANTTVNDFTISSGTLNLSGGNCGQANGATLTLKTGDWVNSGGTFNPGSGTIAFAGTSAQHISGSPTVFFNLTNGNSAGLTLSSDTTVNSVLALTSSDITTGTNTLIQPSTSGASTGTFDVVGTYQRTGSPLPNTALTYGNPNNVITLSGSALTSISVQLTKGSAPASLPKAVQRSYVITPTGSFTSASLQLHYLSGELNGNTENAIVVTRFDSGLNRWVNQGATTRDTTNKWVQATGVTQFSTFTFISPPSITSINPNQGKTAGGTNVTITGSYLTGASGVTIGGNTLTNVSVVSDTQITGTTPAGTIGAASVIVTAAGGSNAANSLFTYIGLPAATNGGPVKTVVNTAVNFSLTATDPNNPAETLSYSYSQPAHGTVTGSGPTVTYTPTAGYSGSDSFTFSATNSFGLTSNTATESLIVAAVAQNQSVTVPFNTATPITLTGSGAGTYIVVTNPTHGTLSGTAPNLTYTPTAGYSGLDSFTFKINNGVDSNTATVSISVLPAPPTANNQSVTVAFNTAKAVTLTASGTGTITYSVATNPTHGTLSGTAPNLTYTPATGYSGPDSFTFTASNGSTSNPATVSLTVQAAAPVANNQSVSVPFNTATALTLTASGTGTLTYTVLTNPTHGTLSGTAPNLTYTPTTGYTGPDSFTFKANNGTDSNTATVSITVSPGAPVANNQSVSVAFNTPTAITLTASGSGTLTYSVVTSPTHGTLSGTAPSLTYTPAAGYSGPDSFTFKANNGTDSNTATVSITVAAAAPVANNQSVTVNFNTAKAITLTASGTGTLTYTVLSSPAHGTLSGTAPNVTYTPATGYSGPDSFTFKANNGNDSNTATVSITVLPAAPVANNQSVAVPFNTATAITLTASGSGTLTYSVVTSPTHGTLSGTAPNLTYTPTAGYSGPDSFTFKANNGTDSNIATVSITVSAGAPVANDQSVSAAFNTPTAITLTATGSGTLTYTLLTGPTHGTLSGTAPNLTYTPASGYSGPDSFTFKANNGTDSNTATVSITVSAGAPVANNQSVTMPFNTPTAITLTASGTGTLTYSVVTSPAHGTFSGTAPNLTYTPASGYSGPDSFTFKANNGTDSNIATVSITVSAAAPVTNNQSMTVPFNTATPITLTASGSGTLTYTVLSSPLHGTLSGTAPNLTYTPGSGYSGPDSFTFKANNGTDSNTATVSITVANAAPVANNQNVSVPFNTATPITLTATGSGTLTYTVLSGPSNGTLSGTAPNLTYTPATGYSGPDSFTFKVNNGTDSNIATVSITVQPAATGGQATLLTTAVLSNVAGGYQALVTVTNSGGAAANNAQLTVATLGAAGGTPLPQVLGNIPANGGSITVTVFFPSSAGASGATVKEVFGGTYTGGGFGGSFRARLP